MVSTASVAATKAVSTLRSAENGAARGNGGNSFYTGTGRDNSANGPKLKGSKKSKAALITVLMLLFGGGAFLGSSHSMLAPAIEALFTEATDTQYTSNVLRSTTLMKYALKGESAVTTTWTGVKKYTHMSSSFKKRLAANNIEVDGSNLVFTKFDPDGTAITRTVTPDDFADVFKSDVDFRDAYSTSKRGRVASFFDNIADKIYKKLGISRNLFNKFKQTGDSDIDVDNYRNTMTDKFDGNESTARIGTHEKTEQEVDVKDNQGNVTGTTTEEVDDLVNPGASSGKSSGTDIDGAKNQAKSLLSDIAGKVSAGLNWGCAIMQAGTMISTLVAANEIYQSINYFMGLTENVSKMKAGYGDASALNEVLNFLSTSTTTTINDLKNPKVNGSGESASTEANEKPVSGSPLEANGMQMILANAPKSTATNDNYSLERTGNAVVKLLASFGTTAAFCNAAKIGTSIVSIAITLTPAGLAKIAGNLLFNIVLTSAISFAASAVLGFIIPTIAQALFTNIFDLADGIPAGELFARGGSAANTRLGRNGSGQSLSSKSAALAYNHETQTVLALDAEVDRKNRSPFDTTSKNTFLGSIAYSLLPTITNTKMTSISSLIRSTSTSISSLMSSVHADGEDTSYMTSFGTCEQLESIGAVGDIYCNPVTTTDTDTTNLAPDDATYADVLTKKLPADNPVLNLTCDSDGNCTVNNKSNLARYIAYCDNRDSPFGVIDQNILNELSPSGAMGSLGTILGSIPILGDIMDIFDAVSAEVNEVWATGERCGNTDKNSTFWNSEGKYYQRFVEDMRLLGQMGNFDDGGSNPVTAYEEQYEAEHPLDNSYEGYLARISGLTKENVEFTLAFVNYYNYINDYDPATRLAHAEETLHSSDGETIIAMITSHHPYFSDDNRTSDDSETTLAAKEYILYADLRTRNFVA